MPPFEWLTEDRPLPKQIKPTELLFVSNFMAWFVHEDDDVARRTGWADLWKFALWYADDAGPQARAGPPPDLTWRWLAELAEFAAEEGNVRLPAHALGCVLYWELLDCDLYDFSQGGAPWLRPPVASSGVKATLAAVALRCLLMLPSGEGVLTTGAACGPLRSGDVRGASDRPSGGRARVAHQGTRRTRGDTWLSTAGTRDGGRRCRVTEAHSYRGHSVRRADHGVGGDPVGKRLCELLDETSRSSLAMRPCCASGR